MDISAGLGASAFPTLPQRVTSTTTSNTDSSKQIVPTAPSQATALPPPALPTSISNTNASFPTPGYGGLHSSSYGGYMPNRNYVSMGMGSGFPVGYGTGYSTRYGGYGSSGYGSYGNGYNNLMAELNNLPALQSLQSVVQTFGSVSVMMESCYNAVITSFQAMMGVADQFSKVKLYFTQLFGAIATFRLVKFLAKHLPIVRKASASIDPDQIWGADAADSPSTRAKSGPSLNVPLLLYLGHLLAAPYIIWKLMNSGAVIDQKSANNSWIKGEGEYFIAKASFPFTAGNQKEMSLSANQLIVVAPHHLQQHQQQGWLLAAKDDKVGLVPANYIKIISKRSG